METINVFPGYTFNPYVGKRGANMFRGEDVGFGGYVYAEPGIYSNVTCFDIVSAHINSIINLNLFGDKYTKQVSEMLNLRVALKHKDFDAARKMFGGSVAEYLNDPSTAKSLSQALKIALNAQYGQTSASFDNLFRDKRNKNNIVALRGALFMVTLRDEIQSRGFTVVHIKTDSIKVVSPTKELSDFIFDFAKKYGYTFEIEHHFERICLVNDSVYIAKCADDDPESPGEWTATGAQFQHPYVFKKLFSGEQITFSDLCEAKNVSGGAIYLDMNEKFKIDEIEEELSKRKWNSNKKNKNRQQMELNPEFLEDTDEALVDILEKAHDYRFVGKTGLFVPIKHGCGGGIMVRDKDGSYYAVNGTKGYRWLEAETVVELHKEKDVDRDYHEKLVSDAIIDINKFGSFDDFIDVSKPYTYVKQENATEDSSAPWDELPPVVPCGDPKYNTCLECPNCKDDICKNGYSLNAYIEKGASA